METSDSLREFSDQAIDTWQLPVLGTEGISGESIGCWICAIGNRTTSENPDFSTSFFSSSKILANSSFPICIRLISNHPGMNKFRKDC
jgi:hypothetical protein